MATPLTVPPEGLVLKTSGSYLLTGPVSFSGLGAIPAECQDPKSRVAVTGILIQASDVTLDLGGYQLGQSSSAALRSREFSCVRVTGDRVQLLNGTIGRSSAYALLASGASRLRLERLAVRDFEMGGILVAGGDSPKIESCTIGPNFQGRRPSGDLSLAARYLPTLEGLPEETRLEAKLAASGSSGPFRSDLGSTIGLELSGCSGQPIVQHVRVVRLVQRPEPTTFLTMPNGDVPQGALGDPIPATGASPERQLAHEAAAASGRLPPPERQPVLPPSTPPPCSTFATNLGVCSSAPQRLQPKHPSLLLGLDVQAKDIIGSLGIRLKDLSNYVLLDLEVVGLQAALAPGVRVDPGLFTRPVSMGRRRPATADLLLINCRGGISTNVPEPILVESERPLGSPCNLPPGFSAAWTASGSSSTVSRPVGNPTNVQVAPVVLPPVFLCRPS